MRRHTRAWRRNGHAALSGVPGTHHQPDAEPGEGTLLWGTSLGDAEGHESERIVLRAEDMAGGVATLDRVCEFLFHRGVRFRFRDSWMDELELTLGDFVWFRRDIRRIVHDEPGETDGEGTVISDSESIEEWSESA